jgi:hypothetical protein
MNVVSRRYDRNQAAIDRAKQIDPKAGLDIARVRHTKNGHPDQFRKH